VAYLADIFGSLNSLKASMQGPNTNLISLTDKVSGFVSKLEIWQCRVSARNIDNLFQLKTFLQLPEAAGVKLDNFLVLINTPCMPSNSVSALFR